ncbi:MAG: HD domain-containing protein [Clostridiales bacterium]|nr:HD domain-containing protein [Clostridiales bacterium]
MNKDIITQMYENLPVALILTNPQNKIQYINAEFTRMTGYSITDLIGKPVDHMFSNDFSLTTGRMLVAQDNLMLPVGMRITIIHIDDIELWSYVFLDKSYQCKLENQLRIEGERMKEAKELAKFGHWELDLIADELYWSDEVYRMFDVDQEKFSPSYEAFLEKIHPEDVEMVNDAYLNSVQNHLEYEIDHRILINNEVLFYKEKGRSFYDGKKPLKSIGMVQDITERVKKEIEVNLKEEELLKTKSAIINALSGLTDMRDNDTGKHIERTQTYVKLMSEALKSNGDSRFDDEFISILVQVSSLHDIGKVGISDAILLKPGKLTDEEFEIMKDHTTIGYNVIEETKRSSGLLDSVYLDTTQKVILHHHERWNGSGYPNGLKGSQISIEGRIMSLVDVYDALRSERVYKKEYSHAQAVDIIKAESGKQFDPDLVKIFLMIEKEFKKVSNDLKG